MKLEILSQEERLVLNELGEKAKLEAQARQTAKQIVGWMNDRIYIGPLRGSSVDSVALCYEDWQELKEIVKP